MHHFKVQPIVNAATGEIAALEILSADPVPMHDPAAMCDIDLAALRYAALLRRRIGLRIHSNIEYTTILNAWSQVQHYAAPGVVLELLERTDALRRKNAVINVLIAAKRWRDGGGLIAFDDVSMHNGQILAMIGATHPDIVKVESTDGIEDLRRLSGGARIIVERIETQRHAKIARAAGADELQGFYIDRLNAKLLGASAMLAQ